MLHFYLLILIGLCSFEAQSQEPVSPTKRNQRAIHIKRSEAAARKLLFHGLKAERKREVERCKIPKYPKANLIRLNAIADKLNDLYQENYHAFNSLKYFDYYMHEEVPNYGERAWAYDQKLKHIDMQANAKKHYEKLLRKYQLLDNGGHLYPDVKFVYENCVIAPNNFPDRVDEYIYEVSLPSTIIKKYEDNQKELSIEVPNIIAPEDIEQEKIERALEKLQIYKSKHPNGYKKIPALFNQDHFQKLMEPTKDKSLDECKQEWASFLESLRRAKLVTKYYRPISGLKHLYLQSIGRK
ncbi:MAG: hypothetical protein ACOYT8_05095 [Candidatus Dependentiae bacterium]